MTGTIAFNNAWELNKRTGQPFSVCLSQAWQGKRVNHFLIKITYLLLYSLILIILNSSYKDFNESFRIQEYNKFQKKQKFVQSILITFEYKDFENLSLQWYASYVWERSKEENLDPYLIFAFGFTETQWNKNMVGLAKETGVLQFIPSTAKWLLGDKYKKGVVKNIMVSTELWFTYINILRKDYKDLQHILLSYNMGPGRFSQLMRYYKNDINKVKWHIYHRKGYKAYDDKINYYLNKISKI